MKTNRTIRLTKRIASIAALATSIGTQTVEAQTWQTVLDYQFVPGQGSGGLCIAAGRSGNVFAGGDGDNAVGTVFGLVLRTDTTATSWYLSDDTNPSANQYSSSTVRGIGIDSNGNVY